MFQQQQHRHQKCTNYRHKIRVMDSKKLQGSDCKQQNEQHHGGDLLAKLGITLNATKNAGKNVNIISQLQTKINIIKWVFRKYPQLCTRLGRSKNQIAKLIFKTEYSPAQHKGRRVPLHLQVENETNRR